jgi:hypothetical protein
MSKLRLGIDCDGVLSNYGTKVRRVFLDHYGINVPANPPSWTYVEHMVGEERWKEFWDELVVKYGVFQDMACYPENMEPLQNLLDIPSAPEIHIITKVPESCINDRKLWLHQWLPAIPAHNIHILSADESKGKIKMDAYLDDFDENIEEIAAMNPEALVCLQERSWNFSYETELENVLVVQSMEGFLGAVSDWEKSGLSAKAFLEKNFAQKEIA